MNATARNGDPEAVRVLLIDDHPVVRRGVRLMLERTNEFRVCGEAGTAREARRLICECAPDVVILDVSLEDASGLELLKELRDLRPDARTLVLSMHDEAVFAARALRAGAHGYVMKDAPPDRLLEALRQVARGEVHVSGAITTQLLARMVDGRGDTSLTPMDALSDRELEVFEFIGRGMATRQIADTLHLSVKTIESHRQNIKRKLRLPDAVALLKHATHWVQHDEPL